MRDAIVTEYVELCEQLAAAATVDAEADEAAQLLYGRLDQLWYVEMLEDEQIEAADRLVAGARSWHDARRASDRDP